jgi:hypothetical protein
MLRDLELFKEVKKVEGQPGSIPAAVKLARAVKSDLLLIPKVKQFNVTYEGRNGTHIPKVIVWSLFEWASWFMADELYRVDMACEFQFRHGGNGNLLYSQHLRTLTRKPVSDIQRGIKIWGIVRMPGSLNEKNYRKVGSVVGPHAIQDMEVSFLQGVLPGFKRSGFEKHLGPAHLEEKPPDEKPPPPVETGPKRNIAFIFGVDDYDELTISRLDHAVSDAKAFRKMLSDSVKPEFKDGDLHFFTNEWASRNGIEEQLGKAVSVSSKKLGTVVFYFAGRGAVVEDKNGEPVFYLLPQDADLVNLRDTALSLDRVATALRLVNAENVIAILDCGFDPSGEGRSAPTGASFLGGINYPSALYTRPGRALLTASAAGRPAYESAEAGGGLLTSALTNACRDSKALGTDRALGMREAHDYAKARLGAKQEPKLFGPAAKSILFGK